MADTTTDLVTMITSASAAVTDHEARLKKLENAPQPAAFPTSVSDFTADEVAKIRYVFDKYFPLEIPPSPAASATQTAPAAQ